MTVMSEFAATKKKKHLLRQVKSNFVATDLSRNHALCLAAPPSCITWCIDGCISIFMTDITTDGDKNVYVSVIHVMSAE